jgi:hypothetical protein
MNDDILLSADIGWRLVARPIVTEHLPRFDGDRRGNMSRQEISDQDLSLRACDTGMRVRHGVGERAKCPQPGREVPSKWRRGHVSWTANAQAEQPAKPVCSSLLLDETAGHGRVGA